MSDTKTMFEIADVTANLISIVAKESLKPRHIKHRGLSLAQLLTYQYIAYCEFHGVEFIHSRKTGKKLKTLQNTCDALQRKCPRVMREMLPILISPELNKLNDLGFGTLYDVDGYLDPVLNAVRTTMLQSLKAQGVDTSYTEMQNMQGSFLPAYVLYEIKLAAPLLGFRGKHLRYFNALIAEQQNLYP